MFEIREELDIEDLIYEVRGKKVMLDSDLAKLYCCKNGTKEINQAVKNNPDKFPLRYCFKLEKDELEYISRSKILTLNKNKDKRGYNIKYLPYVFTEQGIYMLATILKTKMATKATLKIMDTFVLMRKVINENKEVLKRMIVLENETCMIKEKLLEHSGMIKEIFDKFDKKEEFKNKIFFDGEIYDSYSLLVDIIKKAKQNIIIIDNYVDKVLLDILSKKNINVIVLLITDKNKSRLTSTDIEKFNKEYSSLEIRYTNKFHDRFIILDKNTLYHLGASLKDLGNKVFAINKIDDIKYIELLLFFIKK